MPSKRASNIAQKSKTHAHIYLKRFNYTGLLFATIFFCLSVLPSLLPRPWLYQGVISGVSVAVGYGIGVFVSAAIRWAVDDEIRLSQQVRVAAWRALAVAGPGLVLLYLYLGTVWQNEVRELVGEDTTGDHYYFRTFFLILLVSLLLLAIARSVRWLNEKITAWVDRLLPRRVSIVFGIISVVALFWWVVSGVFFNFFVSASNTIYSAQNDTTIAGVTQPTSSARSGSPDSLTTWDSLGRQGQAFVGRGPSTESISAYTGSSSTEPIRVYVGVNSSEDATSRAQLAVKELERTRAFDRKILVLATATGTGWLEPQSVDSIEYMYGGDTAIVTQQYSYLPSWISFLVDKQNARDAGRALFDAVYAAWAERPPESRPKLVAYGLSLGSFGGQAAYSGVNDMRRSLDGALFMGTPNDTELWRTITSQRDEGTPEWQPVYKHDEAVRFAATNSDITKDQRNWQSPRILYIQHASDPVVWFDFGLLFHKPDWLKEQRGPDVSTATRWYPIVTFLQVAVDQFFGTAVPNGHGHNYANTIVNAWGAVAPPEDWNAQKANKLQTIIDAYATE